MSDVIVSSVFIRLRHPVHEAGQTNVFDATTQEWITDSDGKVVAMPEKGPFTPQQLDAKGLTMPVIVNQALQTAMRDRIEALAAAAGFTAERDAAVAEKAQAIVDRDAAIADRDVALAQLAACQSDHAMNAQPAQEISISEKRSLLNIMTLGALGKG